MMVKIRHLFLPTLLASIHSSSMESEAAAFTAEFKVAFTAASTATSTTSSLQSSTNPQHELTKDGVYLVDQMPPNLPPKLKNTYYLLRHGQSWGNVAGVISSARSLATSEKHSLTPLGYEQGRGSAADLLNLIESQVQEEEEQQQDGATSKKIFFYSSPFARARQTAEACLDGIQNCDDNKSRVEKLNLDIQTDIIIEDGIMERFFGRLDDEAIHTYAYVWPVDMFDTTHTAFDVESVAAVSTRLREVIMKIEESPVHAKDDSDGDDDDGGDIVVLASHADVLQIMQLYACNMGDNVGKFSSYRFGNGEVRRMGRSEDTLPDPQPLQPPKVGT